MSVSPTGSSVDNPSPGDPNQVSDQSEQNSSDESSTLMDGKFKPGEEATVDQFTQGTRNHDVDNIVKPLQEKVEAIRYVIESKKIWAEKREASWKQKVPLSSTEEDSCHSFPKQPREDFESVSDMLRSMLEHADSLQSILSDVKKQISETVEQASLRPEESKTSQNIDEKKLQEVRQKMKHVVSPICFQRATKLMEKTTPTELLNVCLLLLDELHRIHKAKNQPSSSRSWIQPTVKVFSFVAGQTFGAHEAILKLVKNIRFEVQITNQQESDIIMIFCPIISRSGSDVEAALSRKEVSSSGKPVILVVMHHTRDVEYSEGRKWTENDPNVVLEVHVLFHETLPGLLQCDRNKQAAIKIQHVLNSHSKYGWKMW